MGGSSSTTRKTEQVHKQVSDIVNEVYNEVNSTVNVSSQVQSDVLQNLRFRVGRDATVICLGGLSGSNVIDLNVEQRSQVTNQVSSEMENRIVQKIAASMDQLVPPTSTGAPKAGGFGISTPFGGLQIGGGSNEYDETKYRMEVESRVKNSVRNAVSTFTNIQNQMRTRAQQNADIEIEGFMLSLGKCELGNEFVARLLSNTIADHIVKNLLKNDVDQDVTVTGGGDGGDWGLGAYKPMLVAIGMIVVIVIVFRLLFRKKNEDQQQQ